MTIVTAVIYYIKEILQIACVLHAETSVLFFALICRFNCVHFESILGGRYRSRGPKRRGPVFCNSPIFGINILFFLYGKMLRLLLLDAVCWRDMCTAHPFHFNQPGPPDFWCNFIVLKCCFKFMRCFKSDCVTTASCRHSRLRMYGVSESLEQ